MEIKTPKLILSMLNNNHCAQLRTVWLNDKATVGQSFSRQMCDCCRSKLFSISWHTSNSLIIINIPITTLCSSPFEPQRTESCDFPSLSAVHTAPFWHHTFSPSVTQSVTQPVQFRQKLDLQFVGFNNETSNYSVPVPLTVWQLGREKFRSWTTLLDWIQSWPPTT